jgi:hypothetical protein
MHVALQIGDVGLTLCRHHGHVQFRCVLPQPALTSQVSLPQSILMSSTRLLEIVSLAEAAQNTPVYRLVSD